MLPLILYPHCQCNARTQNASRLKLLKFAKDIYTYTDGRHWKYLQNNTESYSSIQVLIGVY